MAMIRPETEMKDSGIEYVGAIPKDWDLVRLRAYFGERKNKNKDGNETNLLSLSYGRIIRKNIDKTDGLLPASFNTYNIVEKNDIIIRPTDLQNDKRSLRTGLVTEHGIITSAYIDLMPIGNVDSRFVHYLLHSYDILKVFYNMGSGVRQGLNYSEFSKLKVPMPPLSEQQAIADYLDETCFKIDEIIAEAKASIDEYKELKQSVIDKAVLHGLCNGMMKDSGNDLIGKIPLSWEMRKLKYVADFNPGITTAYDAQKEVGYVPMNCVKNGYMNPLSARLSDMSTGLTGFQDGDIVIAKVTPCFENGNIAVAENLEQGVAFGSSELFVIRTHSINRRFMLYYLQNSVFKNQCISTMTGTGGLKRVSGYFVNNAYITYPPENEQQVIVNYLDEAVKNMDSLIAEKQSLIADLEAYKKSLIYEVVTGKRRVV